MTTPTTETGIVELLPCPFCGPRPEESGEWPQLFECSSPYLTEFSIRCGRCGIEMGDEYRDPLVAAWNTRAAMPDSTQLLQTMAGALGDAEPLVETLHSIAAGKVARARVWRVLKEMRSALAQFRAQEQRS